MEKVSLISFEKIFQQLLTFLGEDPQREGLRSTPRRMVKMYQELTRGYRLDPEKLLNNAIFSSKHTDMVVVRNIEFYSLCEHHLLPFFGKACVAYIPDGKIIGLSKIPRIVDMFARRLQVQEQLTRQIADFLQTHLNPSGVAVLLDALHLCLAMRGARKSQAMLSTTAFLGSFQKNPHLQDQFLLFIRKQK